MTNSAVAQSLSYVKLVGFYHLILLNLIVTNSNKCITKETLMIFTPIWAESNVGSS